MSKVKVVAYTQWAPDNEQDTDILAYCARVSNPDNQENPDYDKLLTYCAKNSHWSVFEMVNIVLEINTSRDISRQILRHSSLKPQEFSQRYENISKMGRVIRVGRLQDEKNRQNSIDLDPSNAHHVVIAKEFLNAQREVWDKCIKEYNRMIDFGFAKECARVLLPEGMTATRLYLNGNVRDWYHFCQVRMGNGTQKEHQEIADESWELLCGLYPVFRKLNNHGE
jgi:thymidylate synthase (FAD)